MSDKFLNTGGSGNVNISNGSTDIFASTLSASNLQPSRAVKTNAIKELVSSNLDIADINNLQSDLTQKSKLNFINGGGVALPPPGQVSVYSKTDNNLYYTTSTGNETLIGAGTSSTVGSTEYKFNSDTAGGDPGTGRLKFDNIDPSNASLLRCSYENQNGTDISNILGGFIIDDEIYVQAQNDADRWYIYNITSSTDQTTYYDFGVIFTRSSAAPSLSNNEVLTFVAKRKAPQDEPDVFSTGIYNGGKITQNGSSEYNISAGSGYIMSSTNEFIHVVWNDINNNLFPAGKSDLFVAIDRFGNIFTKTNTEGPFTNEDSRNYIILGQIFSSNPPNISAIGETVNYVNHPVNQLRDLSEALGLFNIKGNKFTPNVGANLTIDKSSGEIYKHGSNFHNEPSNPNILTLGALIAPNLFFGTKNSVVPSGGNVIDPNQWDNNGTLEAVPANDYTIQRIYSTIANNVIVYYGQTPYANKEDALNAINTDSFITTTDFTGLLLRGFLVVKRNTTDLTDTDDAVFLQANKSGDQASGTTPASATQTFQNVYDNSNPAKIITNVANGALTIQEGTGTATNKIIDIKDNGGVNTLFSIDGKGNMELGYDLDNITIGEPITQTGFSNTCIGRQNMTTGNSSGNANVCIGYQSGDALSGGGTNTLVGYNSGGSITTGNNNTCIGYYAGGNNIGAGNDNTLIGDEAGTTYNGVRNTVVLGKSAGPGLGHNYSTCLGSRSSAGGEYGIALGYYATAPANSLVVGSGINNTESIKLIRAGRDNECDLGSNTHRFKDVYASVLNNPLGDLFMRTARVGDNIYITTDQFTTVFDDNTQSIRPQPNNYVSLGTDTYKFKTLFLNDGQYFKTNEGGINNYIASNEVITGFTTGSDNVIISNVSAPRNFNASKNILIGSEAGAKVGAGAGNIHIGYSAGKSSLGGENVYIGNNACSSQVAGAWCIGIGTDCKTADSNSYQTALGALSETQGNYGIALGYRAVAPANTFKIGSATTAQSITSVLAGEDGVCDLGDASHRFKDIYSNGALLMYDNSGTFYAGLRPPSIMFQNQVWALPSGDGNSGQVLETDGSGNLGWATLPILPKFGYYQKLGSSETGTAINLGFQTVNILTIPSSTLFVKGVAQATTAEYNSSQGLKITDAGYYRINYFCNLRLTTQPSGRPRWRLRLNGIGGNQTMAEQYSEIDGTTYKCSFSFIEQFNVGEDIWVDFSASNGGIINLGQYSLNIQKVDDI